MYSRQRVTDGPAAALMTDPSEVLSREGRSLTYLSYVTKRDKKLGIISLEKLAGTEGYALIPRDRVSE